MLGSFSERHIKSVTNGLLIIVASSILLSSEAHSGGFPICSNIRGYTAGMLAESISNACSPYNVYFSVSDLESYLFSKLTDDDLSAGECNLACWMQDGFNGTQMDECVNSLAASFTNGVIGAMNIGPETCEQVRNSL